MKERQKHISKKWEVSICEFFENHNKMYKVTRSIAELSVSETKVFTSKEEAIKQFNKWLS